MVKVLYLVKDFIYETAKLRPKYSLIRRGVKELDKFLSLFLINTLASFGTTGMPMEWRYICMKKAGPPGCNFNETRNGYFLMQN